MNCKFDWIDRRGKWAESPTGRVKCRECGKCLKTSQTDLRRIRRACGDARARRDRGEKAFVEQPPCVYLGDVRRIIECGCGGRGLAEVHACPIHEQCTRFATGADDAPNAVCVGCPDYDPLSNRGKHPHDSDAPHDNRRQP